MKKLVLCVLALMLALNLCACGGESAETPNHSVEETGSAAQNSPENNEGGTAQSLTLETALSFQLKIQYDFTLNLTDDMVFGSVESGDEEAQAFLSGLEIAGKPYNEGMKTLLNAACDRRILNSGCKVCFTLPCDVFSVSLLETLFAPVLHFSEEAGTFFIINWDVIPEEEPEFEANYLYATQKIEENGETVYIDRWESTGIGNGIKYTLYNHYSKAPNPMFYQGGPLVIGNGLDAIRIKMLSYYENGDWIATYFKDGIVDRYVNFTDGVYQSEEYCGSSRTWVQKSADGTSFFQKYENGIMVSSLGFGEDGTRSIDTYHISEKTTVSETYYPDGTYFQQTSSEDGTPLHTSHTGADGAHIEDQYENGQLVFSEGTEADGTRFEQTYKNGQLILSKIYYADGSFNESRFENGQLVYTMTVYTDGSYIEEIYENGSWTHNEGTVDSTSAEGDTP